METINTKVNTEKKWMIEDRTIYCLHESGRYAKGEPELCNEFYFSVQPDYGRGITDEMANEQAKIIHSSINNHYALVEALKDYVSDLGALASCQNESDKFDLVINKQDKMRQLLNNINESK